MLMSTIQAAKKYGVTTETIRDWIRKGKFEVIRTEGGHFRVKIKNEERRFIYARVSSKKQQSNIDNQIELLTSKFEYDEIISDTASAFNFQRKGLKTILEYAMSGNRTVVMVTNEDRLARSGFGLIKWIVELHGGEIITLDKSTHTEQFDTKELIGFITSFCNSYYGKRSASWKQENKDLPKG